MATAKKKTAKKAASKKVSKKTTQQREESFEEQNMKEVAEPNLTEIERTNPHDENSFPSMVTLMDAGVQKEIDEETKVWNERLFTTEEFKGGPLDRFPLSPSQIGKCALALGRNLSHYLGIADYPRAEDSLQPRIKRIFNRGHLLEDALIGDIDNYTHLAILKRQRRVRLPFDLAGGKRVIEGNIDVEFIDDKGTKILVDIKSKGAYYSANFGDSINETFQRYRETGLVKEFAPNSYLITDAYEFFNVIDLDDFFVDYLLQLNSYAHAIDVETGEQLEFDFCSLYYENKNSCHNYELRWKPHPGLMKFAQEKFEFIYNNVRMAAGEFKEAQGNVPFEEILMDKIPKEFALGSSRCKLCDQKDLCYGKYDPSTKPATHIMGTLPPELDMKFTTAMAQEHLIERAKQDLLQIMAQQDATHITTSGGITYERKWYKSPKPHYELKQVRKPF